MGASSLGVAYGTLRAKEVQVSGCLTQAQDRYLEDA